MKITTLLVLLFPTLALANLGPNEVANVDGAKISLEEFKQSYTQNLLFVGKDIVTKNKVLDDLINRKLGIKKAKKNNLANDPEVQRKIEDILYHAQISKDLEGEFKKIKVTEADIKDYYAKHPEYRTAHILLRVRAQPSVAEVEAALKQINKIHDEVTKDPNKFAQLANRYSQIGSAPAGGDIGFQPAVKLAPRYFRAINGKKVGYISPPIRTQFGYHIIKVLAKKSFKDIETNLYKKIVYDTKRDAIMANYFKDLRKGVSIKINENHIK